MHFAALFFLHVVEDFCSVGVGVFFVLVDGEACADQGGEDVAYCPEELVNWVGVFEIFDAFLFAGGCQALAGCADVVLDAFVPLEGIAFAEVGVF